MSRPTSTDPDTHRGILAVDLTSVGSSVPTIRRVPGRPKITAGPLPTSTRPDRTSHADTRPTRRATRPTSSPRPFLSGFCGHPDRCLDSKGYCPGFIRNGSNAPTPVMTCACTCHTPGGTGNPTA